MRLTIAFLNYWNDVDDDGMQLLAGVEQASDKGFEFGYDVVTWDVYLGTTPVFLPYAKSPDGSEHIMGDIDGNGTSYRTLDATGVLAYYPVSGTPTTFFNSGGIRDFYFEYPPSSPTVIFEDPNGNQLTSTSTGYQDTIGRVTGRTPTADFSGCTGPLPVSSAYISNLSGGGSYKFCSVLVPIQTHFQAVIGGIPVTEVSNYSISAVQSVVQPDLSAWTFEYNSRDAGDPGSVNYGDLTKITLPTGGNHILPMEHNCCSICEG